MLSKTIGIGSWEKSNKGSEDTPHRPCYGSVKDI